MKSKLTTVLVLFAIVAFGQKITRETLRITTGDGIQITHKDEFITITGDTVKPCDRCPKFGSQVIIDTISFPFESEDWYFDFENQRRVNLDTFAHAFDTIYVVSYDLIERQPIPNDPIETVDKFGRKTYDTHLVYRYKKIYIHQERSFRDWHEASDFFIDANRQIDIANLRIDTFLVKEFENIRKL